LGQLINGIIMGKIEISIALPTRERPNNITRLIKSIEETAKYPKEIQVILRIDEGDEPTKNNVLKNQKRFSGRFDYLEKPQNELLSDMWQECFPLTKGPRLMMCADDVVFRTPEWDKIIIEAMPDPKNIFRFVWCNDGIQGYNMPTLPFMSIAWVKHIGYFVPRGYYCDYCDMHLLRIVDLLKKRGHKVGRYLKNVFIEHMHPQVNKAKWDQNYKRRRKMRGLNGKVWDKEKGEINLIVDRISKLISSGKIKI